MSGADAVQTALVPRPAGGRRVRVCLRALGRLAGAAALAALLLSPGPVAAEPDPLLATEIQALAGTDPAAAIARLDAEIVAAAAEVPPDARTLHDLYRMKADLLVRQGRPAEAAAILMELAAFVARHRDVLDTDPVALAREAAALFEEAGDLRAAERAYRDVLNAEAEAGMPIELRRATLATLADIATRRGDEAGAEAYRLNAQSLEAQDEAAAALATRGDGEAFERVEIFYATDRARTGDAYPATFYGAGRGTLDYGVATITVPRIHVAGRIESPSIWSFDVTPSSARHVILKSVEPVAADAFFERMRSHLDANRADDAFVFVHGYNVSFEAAAKRTAQLAHDMSFDGLPILYSWPSHASTLAYIADTAVVRLSGRRLSLFLEDVVRRSGAKRIHLIAHSMGNRALTDALELMALRWRDVGEPAFDQIVFAAPDVDAGLFAEMTRTIRPLGRRLTLYASNRDWALAVSRKLHGDEPRAGQGGDDMLAAPGLDSVDMSTLGEDMLKHGYFADDSSALVDLVSLFWQNPAPALRCGLHARDEPAAGTPVWVYRPEDCNGAVVLPLIVRLRYARVQTIEGVRRILREVLKDQSVASGVEPVVARLLGR